MNNSIADLPSNDLNQDFKLVLRESKNILASDVKLTKQTARKWLKAIMGNFVAQKTLNDSMKSWRAMLLHIFYTRRGFCSDVRNLLKELAISLNTIFLYLDPE